MAQRGTGAKPAPGQKSQAQHVHESLNIALPCGGGTMLLNKPFEECGNGIDDDSDGAVDCADPDCASDG